MRLGELPLALELIGQVLADADHPLQAIPLVADHPPTGQDEADLAVWADHPLLDPERGPGAGRLAQPPHQQRPVVGVDVAHEQVERRGEGRLLQTEDAAQLRAPGHLIGPHLPLEAAQLGDRLGLGELLLPLPQHALGLPLRGDILRDFREPVQLAVLVEEGRDGHVGVEAAAILADTPAVPLEAPLPCCCLQGSGRQAARPLLRFVEDREVLAENLVGTVLLDPLRTRVPAHHMPVAVEPKDGVILYAIDQQLEFLSRRAIHRPSALRGHLPRRHRFPLTRSRPSWLEHLGSNVAAWLRDAPSSRFLHPNVNRTLYARRYRTSTSRIQISLREISGVEAEISAAAVVVVAAGSVKATAVSRSPSIVRVQVSPALPAHAPDQTGTRPGVGFASRVRVVPGVTVHGQYVVVSSNWLPQLPTRLPVPSLAATAPVPVMVSDRTGATVMVVVVVLAVVVVVVAIEVEVVEAARVDLGGAWVVVGRSRVERGVGRAGAVAECPRRRRRRCQCRRRRRPDRCWSWAGLQGEPVPARWWRRRGHWSACRPLGRWGILAGTGSALPAAPANRQARRTAAGAPRAPAP